MRLAIKLNDGKRYVYTEEQSQAIAKSFNYVKLAQLLLGNKNAKTGNIKVLNQTLNIEDIKSFEFFI